MNPPPTNQKPPAFIARMIRFLTPFFQTMSNTMEEAQTEALETLASYNTRTRRECLIAVQIIAFSLTTMAVLTEAKASPDLTPNLRLRFMGCANALNRTVQQNEKLLTKSVTCDAPKTNARARPPQAPNLATPNLASPNLATPNLATQDLPDDGLTEEEIRDAIDVSTTTINAYCNRLAQPDPAARHAQNPARRSKNDPVFDQIFDAQA